MSERDNPPPSPGPSFILRGHNAVIHSIAFLSPSTKVLVASDDQGIVRGWSLESRRPQFEFFVGSLPVLAVRAISDDVLFTQSKTGLLKIWHISRPDSDAANHQPRDGFEMNADIHSFCKCVLLRSPSDYSKPSSIAFPHGSEGVGLWDTRTNTTSSLLSPQPALANMQKTGMCTSMSALNSTILCGAYEDGGLRVWDIRMQWPLAVHCLHSEPVFGLSLLALNTPGAAACSSGAADGTVVIGRIEGFDGGQKDPKEGCTVTEKGRMQICAEGKKGVNGMSIRGDGKIMAAGCWDGKVRLYAVKKPRQLAALQCHTLGVQAVEFSADNRWLASASEDTRIALWSVFQE